MKAMPTGERGIDEGIARIPRLSDLRNLLDQPVPHFVCGPSAGTLEWAHPLAFIQKGMARAVEADIRDLGVEQ